GAADFDALAAAYLRRHPPTGPDFRSLGAALAEFVRTFTFAGDYGVAPGVLADLVALEQAELEVQDAPDEPAPVAPVAPEALVSISPERWEHVRFRFGDAFRIVRTDFDVHPVVESVARGETPARPAAGPVVYLLSRPGGRVQVERVAPG